MLVYVFSVLAACANAASSVIQRKANKDLPAAHNLSPRLILDLLHDRLWFLGILGIIAGFLLQAAALSVGALAVVQPILIIELPLTLLLAGMVFGQRMHTRQWLATLTMTVGLAGLLYFLSPSGGASCCVPASIWLLGVGANLAVIGVLVVVARHRRARPLTAAALLGVATGSCFGLTAALMKAMTGVLEDYGFAAVFETWQTYAMVAVGALAMFLLQSALNQGPLVAAQPGFTIADPIVSILWGVVVFGEDVNAEAYDVVMAMISALLLGWGVLSLSRSPQLDALTTP
ncbi:MAG TPA: DMT family transporter [Mycobacterium sp.]|nr:DMT family transporter [Mycobacterium sp.]